NDPAPSTPPPEVRRVIDTDVPCAADVVNHPELKVGVPRSPSEIPNDVSCPADTPNDAALNVKLPAVPPEIDSDVPWTVDVTNDPVPKVKLPAVVTPEIPSDDPRAAVVRLPVATLEIDSVPVALPPPTMYSPDKDAVSLRYFVSAQLVVSIVVILVEDDGGSTSRMTRSAAALDFINARRPSPQFPNRGRPVVRRQMTEFRAGVHLCALAQY